MANISPDTPLRLQDAVKAAFPAGGMTVSGLRREIARGRLEAELIANKHFVTLAGIAKMRERCLVIHSPVPAETQNLAIHHDVSWKSSAQARLAARLKFLKEERCLQNKGTQLVGRK